MPKIPNPCRYCADRDATCHTICEKYIAYRKEVDKAREDRLKIIDTSNALYNHRAELRNYAKKKNRR